VQKDSFIVGVLKLVVALPLWFAACSLLAAVVGFLLTGGLMVLALKVLQIPLPLGDAGGLLETITRHGWVGAKIGWALGLLGAAASSYAMICGKPSSHFLEGFLGGRKLPGGRLTFLILCTLLFGLVMTPLFQLWLFPSLGKQEWYTLLTSELISEVRGQGEKLTLDQCTLWLALTGAILGALVGISVCITNFSRVMGALLVVPFWLFLGYVVLTTVFCPGWEYSGCRLAAECDLAVAQEWLADCYRAGKGGAEKDPAAAVKWYRKAADQGRVRAQYTLGLMAAEGEGIDRNDEEAVKWYRKAAEKGYAAAQVGLGIMFQTNRGVPRELSEADRLKEAAGWYGKAADLGDPTGQANLGNLYEHGTGVAKDLGEAARLYRLAADGGSAFGMEHLADLLEKGGDGVPQDKEEAKKLRAKADEQQLAQLTRDGADVRGPPPRVRQVIHTTSRYEFKDYEFTRRVEDKDVTVSVTMTEVNEVESEVLAVDGREVTRYRTRHIKSDMTMAATIMGKVQKMNEVGGLTGAVVLSEKSGGKWTRTLVNDQPTDKQKQALDRAWRLDDDADIPEGKLMVGRSWEPDPTRWLEGNGPQTTFQPLSSTPQKAPSMGKYTGKVKATFARLERHDDQICAVIEYEVHAKNERAEYDLKGVTYRSLRLGYPLKNTIEGTLQIIDKRKTINPGVETKLKGRFVGENVTSVMTGP
jgi:hypothetical protein